jgi:hypothetical protein
MTEYDNEVLARALLLKECPAVVIVQCMAAKGPRCMLGKVVKMGTGYRLAVKPFTIRTEDLAGIDAALSVDYYERPPVDPNDDEARSAWTFDIDDVAKGNIPARCKHGTWFIGRASLRPAVEQSRKNKGKPIYVSAIRTVFPKTAEDNQ